MNVNIRVIDHAMQRYPTAGDWFIDDQGDLQIRVSRLPEKLGGAGRAMELCVGIHELVEAVLCTFRGITAEKVDAFDFEFEERRERGDVPPNAEPGEDPAAPYHREHLVATVVEQTMVSQLGFFSWLEYDDALDALFGEERDGA